MNCMQFPMIIIEIFKGFVVCLQLLVYLKKNCLPKQTQTKRDWQKLRTTQQILGMQLTTDKCLA